MRGSVGQPAPHDRALSSATNNHLKTRADKRSSRTSPATWGGDNTLLSGRLLCLRHGEIPTPQPLVCRWSCLVRLEYWHFTKAETQRCWRPSTPKAHGDGSSKADGCSRPARAGMSKLQLKRLRATAFAPDGECPSRNASSKTYLPSGALPQPNVEKTQGGEPTGICSNRFGSKIAGRVQMSALVSHGSVSAPLRRNLEGEPDGSTHFN